MMEYKNCSDYLDGMLCYGYMLDNRVQSIYMAFPKEDISIHALQDALGVKFEIEVGGDDYNGIPCYIGTATVGDFFDDSRNEFA